jgi:hypothetical protein
MIGLLLSLPAIHQRRELLEATDLLFSFLPSWPLDSLAAVDESDGESTFCFIAGPLLSFLLLTLFGVCSSFALI